MPNNYKLSIEISIDERGETHFAVKSQINDFDQERRALECLAEALRSHIENQQRCPFYKPENFEKGENL